MHASMLKLVYIYKNLLHDSANHMAIFREVKHRG
jgi:hypothetical protein